ncbi:MAG: hypothetical protein AB1668_05185 [Nanoarchaeota archaeon]
MPAYSPEQLRRAYETLCASLSTSEQGRELLGRLQDSFSRYVGQMARTVAGGCQLLRDSSSELYQEAERSFREAKNFLSERGSDISLLLEGDTFIEDTFIEDTFIEDLAGETVRYIMEHRRV